MSKPKTPRALGETEAQCVVRNIRISPQKLNLVAGLIRNQPASQAVATLSGVLPTKFARLWKALSPMLRTTISLTWTG